MLKLYGRPNSSNVQKVMWALDEARRPYELVLAGVGHGGTDEPWFRALNPNGLVPVLVEGDFVLWESQAILRYLAATDASGVLSFAGPRQAALADQWLDWSALALGDDMRTLFFALARTPPGQRDEGALAAATVRLRPRWALLDAWLGRHDHVAGARFSIADIPLAILAARWLALVEEEPAAPNLRRWFAAMAARPAFRPNVPAVSIMQA